jgi:integrase
MPKKKQARNRGQIIPKGDGRWLIRFYLGRQDGKRVYPSELIEGTFSQAQKALTKLLSKYDTNTFVPPSKLTLKEHCEAWLATKVSLGPKTIREYKNRLTKDVYPYLGSKTIASLSGPIIQTWCASLIARGLSPRTVEFSHTVLSASLKYALRHGLLSANPCAFTELPRKIHSEQKVFSPHEAALFIEHSKASKWNALWTLMLTTGLRPQEAAALTWADIDLTARMVVVRRALVEVTQGHYEPRETKTAQSKRALSIPEYTVKALERHQIASSGIGGAWAFANEDGGYYDISAIRKAWKRDIILANANLAEENAAERVPDIKLYGARHSHLTHLLMMPGGHLKVASARAGHSSIGVTGDTYSHVLPEVDREVGDKIGVLLFATKAG